MRTAYSLWLKFIPEAQVSDTTGDEKRYIADNKKSLPCQNIKE